MTTVIRKAGGKDFELILQLNKALFTFEEQFQHEYNPHWTYSDTGRSYFKERFESDQSLIFIAEVEEKAIGYILGFIDTYPYRSKNPICEIENMYVEETFRRQGIGKRLIAMLRREAKKRKVKLLRIGTIAQNESAIYFYRSEGFHDVNLYLEEQL